MRTLFWTGSFHYIKYKGVRATAKQAPIICGAPHTSFYDSILAIILGPSSVVAKSETATLSFFGSKHQKKFLFVLFKNKKIKFNWCGFLLLFI